MWQWEGLGQELDMVLQGGAVLADGLLHHTLQPPCTSTHHHTTQLNHTRCMRPRLAPPLVLPPS